MRSVCFAGLLALSLSVLAVRATSKDVTPEQSKEQQQEQQQPKVNMDLSKPELWKAANLAGLADFRWTKENLLEMDAGQPLTGLIFVKEPPLRTNYRLSFEAARTQGIDFFVGATFPVGEDACTLILDGWSSTISGLSSIDGKDASDNLTTFSQKFDDNKFYAVAITVTEELITVTVDGKEVIKTPVKGHKFSTRPEVNATVPLGFCNFETGTQLRNIRLASHQPAQQLDEKELEEARKAEKKKAKEEQKAQ